MAHRPKIDNSVQSVRSNQNLSCNWTGSADFGRLIPIHWEELLPTDKVITCKPRIEMQMLAFASPTFGKIDLYCHYFLVPIRQIYQKFYDVWSQTGQDKDAGLPYLTPKALARIYNTTAPTPAYQRAMYKHWTSLGLNPFFTLGESNLNDNTTPISFLPFAAYNKIWWDFYRDPEVLRDESKTQYLFDGELSGSEPDQNFGYLYMMPKLRTIKNNWISDLFTYDGGLNFLNDNPNHNPFQSSDLLPYENAEGGLAAVNNGSLSNYNLDTDLDLTMPYKDSAKINRVIEALTRLSERLSLSGKREIEALFARYGVKPKWSEMNLCRYVGGAKSTVLSQDIISTASTDSAQLGAKAGAGYCALDDLNIQVEVDEPSILMGIVSVMPHIHYVQGLSKKWQRKDLTDMFQSSLQYCGQVAVQKREVAMKYRPGGSNNYDSSKDAQTFAFSDPYYEYKMGLDILAGDFMKYHNIDLPQDEQEKKDILYMQSMEQYIDFPYDRNFNMSNLVIDGDQYNKIFSYLGGSLWEDVDDHFHLCIDKDVLINRPMEGYAIPTLETTADPHKKSVALSQDKML